MLEIKYGKTVIIGESKLKVNENSLYYSFNFEILKKKKKKFKYKFFKKTHFNLILIPVAMMVTNSVLVLDERIPLLLPRGFTQCKTFRTGPLVFTPHWFLPERSAAELAASTLELRSVC